MTTTAPRALRRGPAPHRRATTLLTLVVPVLLLAAATSVAFSWRDRLPDPLASHWGPDGVNGTQSFAGLLALLPATGLAFATLLWALAFFVGHSAMTRRFAAATAVWTSAFVGGMVLAMLNAQLDVPTAADARDLGAPLGIAIAGSLVLAVAAAALTPGDPHHQATAPLPDDAPRLPLPAGELAAWVQRVEVVHPLALVLTTVAFAGFMAVTTRLWWLGLVLLVTLGPLLIGMTAWTVTVDRRGLVARSRLPWPRLTVPLEEVEHAEVVTVDPLRQFGGWGLRTGIDGRVGVVVRKGEGLEVAGTGGRRVVVTVDDAATAAALLNTLAARTRG
jgi:hypothetical protein